LTSIFKDTVTSNTPMTKIITGITMALPIHSPFYFTIQVSYPQLIKDGKKKISILGNSNVFQSLINLKDLSLKITHYSFQNNDCRKLSSTIRDMIHLDNLEIKMN